MNQGMTPGFGQTAVHGASQGGKVVSRKSGLLMAEIKKSVLFIMHTMTKIGLLNPAQPKKDLSVV